MAESERFELSVQYHRTHAFQACSFNHSDNSPYALLKDAILFCIARTAKWQSRLQRKLFYYKQSILVNSFLKRFSRTA